jgi:hypothetical protein
MSNGRLQAISWTASADTSEIISRFVAFAVGTVASGVYKLFEFTVVNVSTSADETGRRIQSFLFFNCWLRVYSDSVGCD